MALVLQGNATPSTDAGNDKVASKGPMDQQKARGYAMSLSNEVNMTNCYKHCKHFFESCKSIHFNVLIAYWIMAGYLGPIDSVEEAYQKGHDILLDLTYNQKILKPSDEDPEMIEFAISSNSEPIPCCRHKGFCTTETLGFADLVDLGELGNVVVFTDGMLKSVPKKTEEQQTVPNNTSNQPKGSMLLVDGNHLSRQVFRSPKKLKYLAYFKPRPDSLKPLLVNVKRLSVFLLRDCELLPEVDFTFEKFKNLTVLEISGSSHLTTIPAQTISQLTQLRCLNLSDLLIADLPENFFSVLVELRWVILKGCSKLLSLPTIKPLKNLEALDLSHCTALEGLKSTALPNSRLQILDLSYTAMPGIPALRETPNLTHLFLRGAKVSVLNSLKQLSKLEVLDLSGAQNVRQVKQLEGNKNIVVLDLSRTRIQFIDFVSELIDLRYLILQKCTSLEKLPAMKKLTKLEVLDISSCQKLSALPEDLGDLKSLKELNLSGCTSLGELREGLLDQMSCLLKLDLSMTKVNHLPSFANLTSLRKLSLRSLQLDSLESLASLSNLVELDSLDLMSLEISSSQELICDFVQSLQNLEILNLSRTSIAKLPNLSKLISLRELLLADCQHLKSVLDLQTLKKLEILDLSLPCQAELEIEGQVGPCPSVTSSLRKLVLTNRSGVQKLFPPTSLGKLEYLDLRGTDVEKIAYENMAQVKCIQLPAKIGLSGVRLSRIDCAGNPQVGHLQLGREISEPTEIQIASSIGNKSSMSAGADQLFHLKEGNQGSWEAFIHHFSVSLPPKGCKDKVIYLDGDEFILRDDLSWARRLLNLELKGRSVEIHGFSELPDKIQNVLQLADNVALVGNNFLLKQVDNAASVGNEVLGSSFSICSKAMKVCCIRRCQKMETVLSKEKHGIIAECLERLVLSDLVNLDSICAENVSSEGIESLKHIHLDCCPKLEKVSIASQVPKNLETLYIKFCDKLQALFEETISLNNLQKLNLFELPKLEGIETDLPKLETLSISQCPRLKNLDRVIKSASTSLTQLCLDSCPGLEHVLPSSPLLEKLQLLKISSCSGLVTLFHNTGSSSSSLPELHNLQILKLRNLPKLNSIGGELFL